MNKNANNCSSTNNLRMNKSNSGNNLAMNKNSSSSNNLMVMRQRRIQKLCYDVRISIFCGILTLLFLRSCVSGGEMASPLDDLRQLQQGRRILFNSLLIHNRASISSSSSSSSASQHHESNPHPHEPNTFAVDSHMDRGTLDPPITDHSAPISRPRTSFTTTIKPIKLQLLLTPERNPISSPLLRPDSCTPEELKKYHNLALQSIENTMDYCRLHGIEMHYSYVNNNNKQNGEMHDLNLHVDVDRDGPVRGVTQNYNHVMIQKLTLIYRAVKQAMDRSRSDEEEEGERGREGILDGPKHNGTSSDHEAPAGGAYWIWWIDGDGKMSVFTNMSMELQIEARYGEDYNMVVFLSDEYKGISNNKNDDDDDESGDDMVGSLLIRPCQWSLDVLDLLRKQLMASSASSSQLITKKYRSNTMGRFFLSRRSSSWDMISSKVYLESSSTSPFFGVVRDHIPNIRQADIAEKSLTLTYQPLLTHFKPCHSHSFCRPHNDQNYTNPCPIHSIERAFQVARDQIPIQHNRNKVS